MDVDTAVQISVCLMPLLDKTDFVTIEDAIVYNEAGMALVWNFMTTAGVVTATAVTPTTGDDHDWIEKGTNKGMYAVELPASGGDANNDAEGFGWWSGETDTCLPFRGPVIEFRSAELNNMMTDGPIGSTPATQDQVGAIGTAGGAALPFAAVTDNVISNTIDNAAAVDKGGGLVGIPVTGHAFVADQQVTIAGSTNYNDSYTVVSQTTNEVVITETFVSETFGGSETIKSSFEGVVFDGVQTTNTFTATEANDTVRHILDDVSNVIDIVYKFSVGGNKTATKFVWKGFLAGNGDSVNIQLFDFVGSDWETRAIIEGTNNPSTNVTIDEVALSKHTGTGSDLGFVYVRLITATATNPTLSTDELIVEAVALSQDVYQDGAVWIDTASSNTGTEVFVDGTATRPVNSLANAIIVANLVTPRALTRFQVIIGSTITFAESHAGEVWGGDNWTLALGGQNIAAAKITGATVTGTSTGTGALFEDCLLGSCTIASFRMLRCECSETLTLGATGDYAFLDCAARLTGGAPVIDFNSLGGAKVNYRRYSGGLTANNLASGDVFGVEAVSGGPITLNGADATCAISGIIRSFTNNLTGSPNVLTKGLLNAEVLTIQKGVAFDNIPFPMVSTTDHVTRVNSLTVTSLISKDSGTPVATTNSVTEIGSGNYAIDLTATEMDADMILLIFTATGADQREMSIATQA